jgi:protoheme IX farnesyltransferase
VTGAAAVAPHPLREQARDLYELCKPRVTLLIVFTALAGMLLAPPGAVAVSVAAGSLAGIALVSAASACLNAALEVETDRRMRRTRRRPLPGRRLTPARAMAFAALIGAAGLVLLYVSANALAAGLALLSSFGYAVIYTVLLKPRTPHNIVLGGAAGAMPPVLGWSAAAGSVGLQPMLLFLIIFVWTPPHFWSLALYYREDYARAGFPMLPVARGLRVTQRHILAYTVALAACSLLPVWTGLCGLPYLGAAGVLDALFLRATWRLYRRYSGAAALRVFRFSILYLFLLFAAMIADHYL